MCLIFSVILPGRDLLKAVIVKLYHKYASPIEYGKQLLAPHSRVSVSWGDIRQSAILTNIQENEDATCLGTTAENQ